MKPLKISLSIVTMLLFLGGISFSEEENEFPKIGFIKNDSANVRAGDNVNFESLCKLEKNDPVKIVDNRYSWFKVILPKKAYLYIKSDYVDLSPGKKNIGTVNAMRVNLRAGPDTKYSILDQVSKPETVTIISEENGWYKIEPSDEAYGWIHSNQISLTPRDLKKE